MLCRGQHRKFKYFFGYVVTQILSLPSCFRRGDTVMRLTFIFTGCQAISAALALV